MATHPKLDEVCSMNELSNWIHKLLIHIRVANRVRRSKGGWFGLFSKKAPVQAYPHKFGVLAIMKNESFMIQEWIEHYLSQGAERIYLIDNGSTDDTLEKVRPMLSDERLRLVVYSEQHKQAQHYWSAFQHFSMKDECEWIAIADIDEFWFCVSGETLASYLARQDRYDVIYTNWSNFGTDLEKQPESVRLSLLRKQPRLSSFTKYMFRTSVPWEANDLHVHFARKVGLNRAKIDNSELQLNHYVTKSREYWEKVKMRRGDVFFEGQNMAQLAAIYDAANSASTETCTKLRDLVAQALEVTPRLPDGRA